MENSLNTPISNSYNKILKMETMKSLVFLVKIFKEIRQGFTGLSTK